MSVDDSVDIRGPFGGRLQPLAVPAGNQNVRSCRGESQGGGLADSAVSTSDDGYLTIEVAVVESRRAVSRCARFSSVPSDASCCCLTTPNATFSRRMHRLPRKWGSI
ncbi:hypothetical protein A4G99_18730 [Haladaptatus sp. R4]|nr:hypothetical protein A4G99_18730 [Haladaptatus sp. R4]